MTPLLANALMDLFRHGGPIMWPISAVTIIAIAIITERSWWWWQLSRAHNPELLETVLTALDEDKADHARDLCAKSEDPVLRVLHAGITHRHGSVQAALQAAAGIELAQAGRFLVAMDTIITLAPLLGLLGTVTGIMGSFQSVGSSELAVESVTGGIGEALIATAFGLGIAIVTLIPYNWFTAKVSALQHAIETAANNLEVIAGKR